MERDIKQKRQLIEDLRSKLKQEKDNSYKAKEKIVMQWLSYIINACIVTVLLQKILTKEVAALSESTEQQKHKVSMHYITIFVLHLLHNHFLRSRFYSLNLVIRQLTKKD